MAADVLQLLRAHPVFASLPPKELDALAASARSAPVRARDYVFSEGDRADWLCLVQVGRVKILRHSRAGKDVVLELLGPGEIFGGVAVLERRPYPATAQAMEASVIVKLPADAMLSVSERYPGVIREMALTIGRRLRTAHDSVESLAVDPVEARLAATLLRLAEREGTKRREGLVVPFHLTRQSLADMTGTTVETAIRVVSHWMRDGWVADESGSLVLRNVAALRRLADGDER